MEMIYVWYVIIQINNQWMYFVREISVKIIFVYNVIMIINDKMIKNVLYVKIKWI